MNSKTALPNDLARPNEPAVLILTSLASGAKHGYALTKDITEFAGVVLGPGTLYGALTRLVERGLIAPVQSGDRRQPFEITANGRAALTDAVRAMQSLANEGATRLRLRDVANPLLPAPHAPRLAQ